MLVTRNSKLIDVFKTPSGHDLLARLFYSLGMDESLIEKKLIGGIKLSSLKYLTFNKFNDEAIDAFVDLLNSFNIEDKDDNPEIKKEWWKEAIFYQIYPRSFKDSNGDGIGDINGITSKLDYLKDLGVDALWICPFYDSPNCDNGYDIRDYKKIMAEFGTMDDVDNLFIEAHKRDIKVIIDLVMNHTSDEHEWFKKSLKRIKPYDDYYIWEDKPTNWTSFFSGPAWKYFDERKQYALHLFADKQIDLNWDNPLVREEMYDIANYWLDKGADGFRLDVVSMISKNRPLRDGNKTIGELISFVGIEHYFHGNHLDEYLKEFNQRCLKPHKAYTVGECPGAGVKLGRFIAGDDSDELSQLFSFDHIDNPGKKRFDVYDFDLRKMMPEIIRWQTNYSNHAWPTVFMNNHDNPRMLSKVNKDLRYRDEVAKLLITLMMTLKGTPYIYQGDEIGMANYPFKDLSEYRDVETLNFYELNKKDKNILKRLEYGSRDNARTPMQWKDETYAGFSSVNPWININPDYRKYNVESELKDDNSILNYYKKAIKLRKNCKGLVYGRFEPVRFEPGNDMFIYKRTLDDDMFVVVMNLTDKTLKKPLVEDVVLSNYNSNSDKLRPYEVIVCKKVERY